MALLVEKAKEKSSYVVTCTFSDENGTSVVPVSVNWSLRDSNGAIVNNRSSVSVTPATTISVLLSGNDLVFTPITKNIRYFTIEAIYNSVDLGNSLPLNDECSFEIDPLVGIVDA